MPTITNVIYPLRLSEEEFKNWQAEDSIMAIRTLTRGFRRRPMESETSNLVRLRLLDVSGPVNNMQIETTEKAIELALAAACQSSWTGWRSSILPGIAFTEARLENRVHSIWSGRAKSRDTLTAILNSGAPTLTRFEPCSRRAGPSPKVKARNPTK